MDDVWKGLTALIAATVLWVGLQQWWLGREKLRLELFARRYAVFDAVRGFVRSIVNEAKVDRSAQGAFWAGTADAEFLFEADVVSYIDDVNKKAAKLHMHLQMQTRNDDKFDEHVKAETDLLTWLSDQLRDDGMPAVFGRYLKFQDLQGPLSTATRWLTTHWKGK